MKINQEFIPIGRRNRPRHLLLPEFITIHETDNIAAYADAEAHSAYLLTSTAANKPVSWHLTVDGGSIKGGKLPEIWQHLPLTEVGWHANDGEFGVGNRRSLGIEKCVNADGDEEKAEHLLAELVAFLIHFIPTLRPFPECLAQHWHWSGKNCPRNIRSRINGWDKFLNLVVDKMTNPIDREINNFVDLGIITSPEYWRRNAVAGKAVDGEYVQVLIKRCNYIMELYQKAGRDMLEAGKIFTE